MSTYLSLCCHLTSTLISKIPTSINIPSTVVVGAVVVPDVVVASVVVA